MNSLNITKMLFEKKSYVIYGYNNQNIMKLWDEMRDWLHDSEIKHHIEGNIIRFDDEPGEALFLLRLYHG